MSIYVVGNCFKQNILYHYMIMQRQRKQIKVEGLKVTLLTALLGRPEQLIHYYNNHDSYEIIDYVINIAISITQ